ncbi:MAG: tetratricopeptide repeat protein, partial [Myxococcota bacterium]
MIVVLMSTLGHAQDPPPPAEPAPETPDDLAEARRLYSRGEQWYEEGQYDLAIEAFEKAYAISEAPAILFNIANAQERGGLLQEAIDTLERYRLDAPDSEIPTIRRRILSLESRIQSQTTQPPPMPEPEVVTPSPAPPTAPPVVPPSPEADLVPRRPRWGLVAAGATTAAVFGGVAVGTFAASRTAIDQNDRDGYATLRTGNNLALVGVGGGVLLASAGLVLSQPAEST